jgi:hypothetical protein
MDLEMGDDNHGKLPEGEERIRKRLKELEESRNNLSPFNLHEAVRHFVAFRPRVRPRHLRCATT